MGNTIGKDEDFRIVDDDGFILVSNNLKKELSFDPKGSFILSFGIDKQIHPHYEQKSLGLTVKMDALEVTKALIDHLHIHSFKIFCSSDDPTSCTRAGIEEMIEVTAREVKEEGIFILFFGGHGVNDGDKKWALAPADFDLSPSTYITSDMINRAVSSSKCKAKYVLVILDCCYSGMMGNYMTSTAECLLPNLYVLAAGTAYESSFAVASLQHSIFSYFLKVALNVIPQKAGFPLAEVYQFCKDCTTALSSLILTIDNCTVKTKHVVPSLSHFNPVTDDYSIEDTDGELVRPVKPGRLRFVFDLFNETSTRPRPKLHPETHRWLRSLICGQYQPIYLIEKLHPFENKGELGVDNDCLLQTIVALIMQSIAVLEIFHGTPTAGEPDIFLLGFVHTMAVVDFVLPNCVMGVDYMILSWALYHRVLVQNNIDDQPMKELFQKVKDAYFKESGESVNSIEVKEWSPLL